MDGLWRSYLAALQRRPLAVKSATSCALTTLGKITACSITGEKAEWRSLLAFAVFGGAVSGPLPHAFFNLLEKLFPPSVAFPALKKLLAERLVHAPVITFLFFFVTKYLQTGSVGATLKFCKAVYPGALVKNWQYWTPAMIINLTFVPLELRVLFASAVAFVWNVYLAVLSSKSAARKPAPKQE